MNWINPRDKLPEENQLVWCLIINIRKENSQYDNDSSTIFMGQAKKDQFGIIVISKIGDDGYVNEQWQYTFYSWAYSKLEYSIEPWRSTYQYHEVICAWAPYEGLPVFDHIGLEESKKILSLDKNFNDRASLLRAQQGKNHFIKTAEQHPKDKGLYIVITDKQMSIIKYSPTPLEIWKDRNGDEVIAWFPIPESY